ncbi:MAG: Gldg family protein, partial [Myxococcota bacterium]
IAIIFLGVYLAFTLYTFFAGTPTFFARGLADLRPMFFYLPLLLVFLCSTLTMRQWSEEQKMGTLEVLLTLPVKLHHLVLGKFLASLALVSLALLLTLPIPIVVSTLGDVDWGPVIGGYVGAVLLASAYLSIGLFISALTDNQIISLILSVVVGGLLWFVGAPVVLEYFDTATSEVFAGVGTGSRFESVRRGVLDLRDLVYYLSITATFLTFNVVVLASKGWSDGARTRKLRTNAIATAGLVAVNALLLNFVLAPVTALRVDLTERQEYSISQVTKDLVRGLPEPLLIRGYFSGKTDARLAASIPRIRDTIEEYGIIGGDTVRTEYIDPRGNAELEDEADQLYGIKPIRVEVSDVRDVAIVTSNFSILVKYGDRHEVLDIGKLIDVPYFQRTGEVKLQNLEYDLTSTIKKVAFGFQSTDEVFAKLDTPARFTAFMTPDETLPEGWAQGRERMQKVLSTLKEEASGRFEYEVIDPSSSSEWTPQKIFDTYGLRPQASLFSTKTYYFQMLLKVGDLYQRIGWSNEFSESDLREEIVAALKRGAPGFLKTVGLVKPETPDYSNLPPQIRQQMPPPPPDVTQLLRAQLSENYTVKDTKLDDGIVASDVDVLVVQAPENFDAKKAFAVDQFLMKGGTVVVLGGRYALDIAGSRRSLSVKPVTTGLEETLEAYGLRLESKLVLDPRSESIPQQIPRGRQLEVIFRKYPLFPVVGRDGMAKDSLVLGGIPQVVMPWASAIAIAPPTPGEGEDPIELEYTKLLSSSDAAWTQSGPDIEPDYAAHELGYAPGSEPGEQVLAAMASGRFASAFRKKGPPEGIGVPMVERSPESARLVVLASSSFASDVMQQLSRQSAANYQLLQNLVDFGVEDTELLSIRARGTSVRTLAPLEKDAATRTIAITAGLCLLGLLAVVVLSVIRRRTLRPIPLDGDGPRSFGEPQEVSS